MFGIIIFILCIVGLWHVLKRPRSPVPVWWDHTSEPNGPWTHRRHGVGRQWMSRALVDLDTTPTQERIIFDAIDQATDELRESGFSMLSVRKRIADVFRHDSLSSAEVEAALEDESGSLERARAAIGNAFATIHGVLDDRQRRALARRVARPHIIF